MTRRDRLDGILSATAGIKRVAESLVLLTTRLVEGKFTLDRMDDLVIWRRRAVVNS